MLKYIVNDQIIDQDKALVHVSDLTLLRGYGVFDFFRLVELQPLYFDDHIERFFSSADALRQNPPSAARFWGWPGSCPENFGLRSSGQPKQSQIQDQQSYHRP